MINGINHLTLSVRDLDESLDFYTKVLGCDPMAKWSGGAYLLAGGTWIALIVDPEVRNGAPREYSHIAFDIELEDFPELSRRIILSGAEIWQANRSEGASLYFCDPNGHKLELHTSSLTNRLRAARDDGWEGLEVYRSNT